jgi:hypothetical protein
MNVSHSREVLAIASIAAFASIVYSIIFVFKRQIMTDTIDTEFVAENECTTFTPTFDISSVPKRTAMLIYPTYGVRPDDPIEQAMFDFANSHGTLPRKIEGIDTFSHMKKWHSILTGFNIVSLGNVVKVQDILVHVRQCADLHGSDDDVFVIVLCGHGHQGGFCASDGGLLPLHILTEEFTAYNGTVLFFLMFCDARPQAQAGNPTQALRVAPSMSATRRMMFVIPHDGSKVDANTITRFLFVLERVMQSPDAPTYDKLHASLTTVWTELYAPLGIQDWQNRYSGSTYFVPTRGFTGRVLAPGKPSDAIVSWVPICSMVAICSFVTLMRLVPLLTRRCD